MDAQARYPRATLVESNEPELQSRGNCSLEGARRTTPQKSPAKGTMLTAEEIQAIPLFSTLAATDLEHLAQTSADIHLDAGEWAVPEGGERALFAVLSGKIEVVKTIDGVERRLGWRLPGTIFGEVPIALGTPFPGGYRAAEPSRVVRIDPREYSAIAAASAEKPTRG